MITKTFEFQDYDGNMRKEEHSFHLTKSELWIWFLKNILTFL